MRQGILRDIRGAGLIVLLALALVATAFAHHLPGSSDLSIETYVLAGGDISDLCEDDGAGGKSSHRNCPACHIIGSALLGDMPQALLEADYIFVSTVVAPRESRAIRVVRDPAHGMGAPPLA